MKFGTSVHCTKKTTLKKNEKEAARIATGTTKLVSTENLYGGNWMGNLGIETGRAKLILFIKL